MTKFYTYNIQLLPNEDATEEVGTKGYKKLFAELRDVNKRHRTNKTLEDFHHRISGDVYIGPDEFYVKGTYFYGYFVRYTKTDEVKSLNSKATVFKNKGKATTVSKDEPIPFVFDAKRHYFCIEGNSVLSAALMTAALTSFLKEIAVEHFPQHELTVNSVSEPSSLEEIFQSAVGYKTIRLRATFENGHEETQGVLKQLKDSKTKTINVNASGGTSVMNKLPPFLEELARAAVVVGALQMSYYVNGNAKRLHYDSTESPLQFVSRWSSEDDDSTFFERVHGKLLEHADRAEQTAHVHRTEESDAEDSDDEG